MGLLVLACLMAWAGGAQSEQAKLGISPAQRDQMREEARHTKAIRKIAEKHSGSSVPEAGARGAAMPASSTLPAAFAEGYRGFSPVERVATPMGRRTGEWAARGVMWAKDTGRSAVKQYRHKRKAAGQPDPAPLLVPLPPAYPPATGTDGPHTTPPPAAADGPSPAPPTAPVEAPGGPVVGPERPPVPDGVTGVPAGPEAAVEPPSLPGPRTEAASETKPEVTPPTPPADPAAGGEKSPPVPPKPAHPPTVGAPPKVSLKKPEKPESEPGTPTPAGAPTEPAAPTTPAPTNQGGTDMADVSYQSVIDESDDLRAMCDEDTAIYDRIRARCEREIGRGDTLISALKGIGAGDRVTARVVRCVEQYRAILAQLDDLQRNTIAQGEAVVRAKALLENGQGFYAGIAQDMESVADRDYYLSEAVDSEDTAAETEAYELQGATR